MHIVTNNGCDRARECDERTSAEIESSHSTGILKNHRNDAYTRMSQNLTRVNTSQRKQAEAREHKAAVDEIENEITMLTKSHQETRDRLKSLKASKTNIRKQKSSSKAESNSSGRVRTTVTTISPSAKAKKVAMAARVSSKKCMLSFPYCFEFFHFILTTTPAKIKSKQDSSSLSGSSAANQAAAASTSQVAGPTMDMDILMERHGEVLQMDWVNASGDLPSASGAYFLGVQCVLTVLIYHYRRYHRICQQLDCPTWPIISATTSDDSESELEWCYYASESHTGICHWQ